MSLTIAQQHQFETEHYKAAAFLLQCEIENELAMLKRQKELNLLNDWQTRRLAELLIWEAGR